MADSAQTNPLALTNHALALLGEDSIDDFIPESGSTQALAATIYDRVVDSCLGSWQWNFATCRLELSALTNPPPDPWTVQYALPSGTLRILRTDIPCEAYAIYSDNQGGVAAGTPRPGGELRLYATRTGVWADVLVRPLDDLFPGYFSDIVINRLAAEMAPALTGQMQLAQLFEQRSRIAEARGRVIDYGQMPARTISRGMTDPRGDSDEAVPLYERGGW